MLISDQQMSQPSWSHPHHASFAAQTWTVLGTLQANATVFRGEKNCKHTTLVLSYVKTRPLASRFAHSGATEMFRGTLSLHRPHTTTISTVVNKRFFFLCICSGASYERSCSRLGCLLGLDLLGGFTRSLREWLGVCVERCARSCVCVSSARARWRVARARTHTGVVHGVCARAGWPR